MTVIQGPWPARPPETYDERVERVLRECPHPESEVIASRGHQLCTRCNLYLDER